MLVDTMTKGITIPENVHKISMEVTQLKHP